jgi:hypothetical protein
LAGAAFSSLWKKEPDSGHGYIAVANSPMTLLKALPKALSDS